MIQSIGEPQVATSAPKAGAKTIEAENVIV